MDSIAIQVPDSVTIGEIKEVQDNAPEGLEAVAALSYVVSVIAAEHIAVLMQRDTYEGSLQLDTLLHSMRLE